MNVNESNQVQFIGNTVGPRPNDTIESLKKTLQDPNTSMPDTIDALARMYQMTSKKVKDGSASDDEKFLYDQLGALRSGNMPDADRDQLASKLGMSTDRMAEVAKQFQPMDSNPGNNKI